ncbi:MAG: tetratricopeptide repeat protein [Deltaproteobacteria bacterium]|jgi:tetratricopeptide (TPR) repeat protein|nr:tetratricopeptide repeat protein [Deltaproteobacteria bacterium]
MTKQDSELRSKLVALALESSRKGDLRRALKHYTRLCGLDADNPAHWIKLGELQERLGSPAEAADAYFRAAALFVADSFDHKAIASYKRALGFQPARTDISSALAEVHQRLGQLPEAIDVLRGSRASLQGEGRLREALEVRLRLSQLEPTDTVARFELARDLDEAGLFHEAISEYADVIVEFARTGEPDRIPSAFDRLHELRPAETNAARELTVLLEHSDLESVRARIAEAVGKDPDDEAVDQALESLLSARAWRETLGRVYREVSRIHREWCDRGRAA